MLVNNAGITRDAMFHKMTPAQWKSVIDTNLTGLFNMTHPLWSGMRDRKFGRVINISSINGQKGQAGQANYSAAKSGDLGFTKALAQEGARAGITVNAICPGYIGTEMVRAIDEKVLNERIIPQIPVGRLGEPDEIARIVVFLASDDAGFITARRSARTAASSSSDPDAHAECNAAGLVAPPFHWQSGAMTRRRATLVGFTAILMWSLLALLTVGTAPVPPFLLTAICFAIGGALGLVWIVASGEGAALRAVGWRVYAFGTVALFGYHFLYFSALRMAPAAEAG